MPIVYLAPDPINSTQFIPGTAIPAVGAQLFHYLAGSSTKADVYVDNTGTTKWANPIVLDSGGNLGGSNEVWLPAGVSFKFILAPANDTDPPIAPYKTWDNLSGINDATSILTEWIPGPAPTFVSTTSFTLVGDQTANFKPNRRVKAMVTAGTVYGYVRTSVFGVLTTVTLAMDSTNLDAGMSAVWYGIGNSVNPSIPQNLARNLISVKDYGAFCDGVTDDYGAVVSASIASIQLSSGVFFPGFCSVSSGINTSSFSGLKWLSLGKECGGLVKNFNGDLITVNSPSFEARSMHFKGSHGTFTGRGCVFTSNASFPKFPDCTFEAFTSEHLFFQADGGYDFSALGSRFYQSSSQSAPLMISTTTDTTANHRHFVDVGLDGSFDLSGANASVIEASRFFNMSTSPATAVLDIIGNSWAMAGASTTINATICQVVGNRIAGSVLLSSTMSGSFIGNVQTVGTFSTAALGAAVTIHHHIGGATFDILGHNQGLTNQQGGQCEIFNDRVLTQGDNDLVFLYGFSAPTNSWESILTTTRTVSLSTTGARDGAWSHLTRASTAGGAFNLVVSTNAGVIKNITASTWAIAKFDGGNNAWKLCSAGSL